MVKSSQRENEAEKPPNYRDRARNKARTYRFHLLITGCNRVSSQKEQRTMFRGNHPTRVDEKGRLKVPAEFKRLIDEKYGTQFYITSLDGKVAQVYPFEEWQRIEEKLAKLSNFNPTKKKFLNRTNYYGQLVEIDGQGRVLIPALLRDTARIQGEVAVVGNLTYLEVQSIEAYKKDIEENPFTQDDEKTLDELGI